MDIIRRLRTMRGCGREWQQHLRPRLRLRSKTMGLCLHENALIALTAAASWGGGDFSGGMGVKASGGGAAAAIRFVVLAHAISLVVLLGTLWGQHAGWPHGGTVAWAVAAGVMGALGVAAFYMALSRGGRGGWAPGRGGGGG